MVRGVTGFGGAMVMSPPLAFLLGPLVAVPAVQLLESLAAVPMLVQTRRLVRWRIIGPIIVTACVAFPLGGYILVSADPKLLRRAIAGLRARMAGWMTSSSSSATARSPPSS